ncbi:MAG: nodulation protein, partial [Acidobacteria bacterium]|nr:nodulation protein [Acidobacteriota bacterium]
MAASQLLESIFLISTVAQFTLGTEAAQAAPATLEPAFWELHRWWVIGVVLFCLLETALIVVLLIRSRLERLVRAREEGFRQELAGFSRAAAVRELMASLAHELNQPLAAILGNAQAAKNLVERGNPDLKELREICEDIVADDHRAAEAIRSIRSMLKKPVAELQPLGLNDLIQEIIPVIRNDCLLRKASIDLGLGLSLPSVRGDRIQLQQVIHSLVINALEAMESSERERKLVLRTRQSDRAVVLDVTDSGPGIPADKIDSIFDMFVSTKPAGLGMGLFLSRSIVIGHNGRLRAENNSDGGATFHVELPVEDSLGIVPAVDADSNRSDAGQQLHGLTVLIADDRESFRQAVSSILTALPELKLIAEAADGAEAIKKA